VDETKNKEIDTFVRERTPNWTEKVTWKLNRPQWEDQVDDVVQDIALKVFKEWDSYDGRNGATRDGWADVIAENCIIDFFRRERAKKRQSVVSATSANIESGVIDTTSKEIEPLTAMAQNEDLRILQQQFASFSGKIQEILTHRWDGMTDAEISMTFPHLGSANSIRNKIYEFRKNAKQYFQE
jgi:RNA polymerase sigma factor (sigma-70 family)